MITWSTRYNDEEPRPPGAPWGLPLGAFVLALAGVTLLPAPVREMLEGSGGRLAYYLLIMFSIVVGWYLQRISNSRSRQRTAAFAMFVIIALFVWPQQYRISCWKAAGERVDSIIAQTVALVPEPAENSTLIFNGIPLVTKRCAHAYVFGQGMHQAIAQRYGRSDLTVNRWGWQEDIDDPPENSYVFVYQGKDDRLTLVHRAE